ncbi:two-component response regulator ARR22-like [Vigna radiata var. radiata]|uniref:Two-component response regulator ARR22-like n=1 Tax=Vigna radiata var. radiata TaxID=3916 RepID=A0A1S3TML2_VIGRR|nr:two-component response regulator ARR22-like [Vigna radiata var. radiata]
MARRNFGSQITALVVDDNVLNRRIHEKLLESAGVRNHEGVENGKVAVDIHCHGRRFDLILMDMDMPIMNGIQATKELRSMGIGSMIVGVSSRSTETEIRKFMESGLNDYHEKPLNTAKLNSILDKMNPNFINK